MIHSAGTTITADSYFCFIMKSEDEWTDNIYLKIVITVGCDCGVSFVDQRVTRIKWVFLFFSRLSLFRKV